MKIKNVKPKFKPGDLVKLSKFCILQNSKSYPNDCGLIIHQQYQGCYLVLWFGNYFIDLIDQISTKPNGPFGIHQDHLSLL